MLDILVIAPHPDDAELGMAGAILKFKAEGAKVGVLDLEQFPRMPPGDHQRVAAGPRVDVHERDRVLVLVDDLRGKLARDDLAEDAVVSHDARSL